MLVKLKICFARWKRARILKRLVIPIVHAVALEMVNATNVDARRLAHENHAPPLRVVSSGPIPERNPLVFRTSSSPSCAPQAQVDQGGDTYHVHPLRAKRTLEAGRAHLNK